MKFVRVGNLSIRADQILATKIEMYKIIVYCEKEQQYTIAYNALDKASEAYKKLMEELVML